MNKAVDCHDVPNYQQNKSSVGNLLLIVTVLFLSYLPNLACAQADSKICFSVEKTTLDHALEKLYAECQVNVAFSKKDLSLTKVNDYSAINKTADEILTDLLSGTDFIFRKIGRQYVVRRNAEARQEPSDEQENTAGAKTQKVIPRTNPNVSIIVDTIKIVDTVVKWESIIQVDTVIIVDTLLQVDTVLLSPFDSIGKDHFFIGISCSGGFSFFKTELDNSQADLLSLHESAVDIKPLENYALSLSAGYSAKRIDMALGLSYRTLKYKFSFEHGSGNGGYYAIDTLDTYYVINQIHDTSYFYVIDSTYIPKDEYALSYRDVNSISYLGLNASLSYNCFSYNRLKLYVKAGGSIDFLLSASGSILSDELNLTTDLENYVAPIKASCFMGVGAKIRVLRHLDLSPEVVYRHYLGSFYKEDYPLSTTIKTVCFTLGVSYCF